MFYMQNVGIALEVCRWRAAVRSEDPVYVFDVRVLDWRVWQRRIAERKAVVGLVTLPPADVPRKPVIIERDTPIVFAESRRVRPWRNHPDRRIHTAIGSSSLACRR